VHHLYASADPPARQIDDVPVEHAEAADEAARLIDVASLVPWMR
jgi:hypothetical protein